MRICYFVYREENVMVYTSQVLEYLREIKKRPEVEDVGLVLFRHETNTFKKKEVEARALQYVDWICSFPSLPVLTVSQLRINAMKARSFVQEKFLPDQKIAVICRGELSTVIGSIAFENFDNARVLYDNRGLSVLESEMSYPNQLVHKLNRKKKLWAIQYAKDHCDMYNFVTGAMRKFDVDTYGYNADLPYTIIPTLYKPSNPDEAGVSEIRKKENLKDTDLIISYIGAVQAWQSTNELVQVIDMIGKKLPNARFLLLTKGELNGLDGLDREIKSRIVKKTVPHNEMQYYLSITDIGIVIRNDDIVNRVAAPTKIAEYITNGIAILYKGQIGVFDDLKKVTLSLELINIEDDGWIDQIKKEPKHSVDRRILDYFDMRCRQEETIQMLQSSFSKPKERKK